MPRKPRFFLPNVPVHVVQRGNNRQPIFFDEADYIAYLGWLEEAARRWACSVHAYVLMTNHVHLLLTPEGADGVSRALQYLGRRYVAYINDTYQRSGTLWEGRFKSSLVQTETYLLTCYRYIELNPVRAAMVEHPNDYRWSSYAHNADGQTDQLISEHPEYLKLGATEDGRRETYRQLFAVETPEERLKELRDCLQTGAPLGNDKFREQIEATLGRKVGASRRGRPKKPRQDSTKREARTRQQDDANKEVES